ncbi:MAG: mandelate racemase/muconate lactonizing enzyme family protein [Hyphomicrobiaceae bacterium]
MKISSIQAAAIEIPLKRNFGGSTYDILKRSTIVTKLRTSDGLESIVYNGDNRTDGPEIVRIIEQELAPAIKGDSIFAYERTWAKMFKFSIPVRNRKLLLEAIACVDCAIWDAIGKANRRSIHELLGAHKNDVPLISIGGYYFDGRPHDDIATEVHAYQSAGMAGCKFKVGGLSPEKDAERVKIARSAVTSDFVLAVDANRGWEASDAIRFARLVEPLDIAWFEEPCHWYNDVAATARVRNATSIPINCGQSEITAHGVGRLIHGDAVDMINVDASECGGVTEWRRAAAMCGTSNVTMTHHEESQIALHLMSAIPHGRYIECFGDPDRDPIWHGMWTNRPPVKDGKMTVPKAAGFGIELDPDMIARFRIA